MIDHRRTRLRGSARLVERRGEVASLDGPAEAVAKWARGATPKGPIKNALSGVPIGHAAHPLPIVLPVRHGGAEATVAVSRSAWRAWAP
ncbi:MAG TPA: hypothetical protein VD836_13980 [Solirubrobacteraceae bacterium]|nr:hypothetical protein [Solirubrobacteraceae bacterium]